MRVVLKMKFGDDLLVTCHILAIQHINLLLIYLVNLNVDFDYLLINVTALTWPPFFYVQKASDKEKFQMQFQLENEKAKKIGEIGKIEMMLENEKNSTKRLEEEVGVFSKSYTVAILNISLNTELYICLP